MKLWEKNIPINKAVERFTIGQDPDFDLLLAPYDVYGSLAHAAMLHEIGILSEKELVMLQRELKNVLKDIEAGAFIIEEGIEDVHSQIEYLLTQRLGDPGKKIHTARSRNDQVLVDLKLFYRDAIKEIIDLHNDLFQLLITLAEKNKRYLLPGYTHLQAAMPSSFGLWFGAYAENLVDDLMIWSGTYRSINHNPLGSGAGYGSSLPIIRSITTQLLGFSDLNYNVVHAQMSRGRSELFMSFGIAATSNTLAKLAMDVCMYNGQDLSFIKLADAFTTGSSIMPHKKNPDVFELIRARCNYLAQMPASISAMVGHLPSGYHRDFQLTKELIFPAIDQLKSCLEMTKLALAHIEVEKDLLDTEKYRAIFSVEKVNAMVQAGTPFREAYQEVARLIENDELEIPKKIHHTHEGSIGNLSLGEIERKFENVRKRFDFSYQEKLNELIS